eukprot:m.12384 g.12384  ORF g.12384 m.12384 type:complete len:163 (-) comp17423_c0_seq1:102-590(-)
MRCLTSFSGSLSALALGLSVAHIMASRLALSALRALPRRASTASHQPKSSYVPLTVTPTELTAIRAKEAGSWKALSVEEKRVLYRSTYGKTRAELLDSAKFKESGKVIAGVTIGIAVSLLIFKGLQSIANPGPKTLNPEWQKAEQAALKAAGANPITGVGKK